MGFGILRHRNNTKRGANPRREGRVGINVFEVIVAYL